MNDPVFLLKCCVSLAALITFVGLLSLLNRKVRGLGWVSGGVFVGLLSVLVRLTQGNAPILLSVVLPGELSLLSVVIQMFGLRWFVDTTPALHRRILASLSILAVPCTFLKLPNYFFLNDFINFPTIVLIGIAGWILFRSRGSRFQLPAGLIAVLVLAEAFVSLYGVPWMTLVSAMTSKAADASRHARMPHGFPAIAFLATCANMCALWYFAIELQTELMCQSRTDSLTGLLNRRAFEGEATREIARSVRLKSPLSVLMLDIDRFKELNDAHGHSAGDFALVSLATLVQSKLRIQDAFARFGGEEFIILLPDTAQEGAYVVAERIRVGVETMALCFAGKDCRFSVSIGVAQMRSSGSTIASLVNDADKAMYASKSMGRNRVTIHEMPALTGQSAIARPQVTATL